MGQDQRGENENSGHVGYLKDRWNDIIKISNRKHVGRILKLKKKTHGTGCGIIHRDIRNQEKGDLYEKYDIWRIFSRLVYDHWTSLSYRSCQRRSRTEMYRDRVQQQAGTGEQLLLSPQTVPKILYKFLLVGEFGQQFVLVLRKVIGKQLIRIIQL